MIKEELAATDARELPAFITCYEQDERAGVKKLVETARKRYEKLQEELARTEALKKYEKEYDNDT